MSSSLGRVGLVGDINSSVDIDPNAILSINTRPYRWLTIPIYILYIIFITLIWVKLDFITSLSWLPVLLVILAADIINIVIKVCHILKETNYLSLQQIIQRSTSSLVELIGLFICKIGIYIYLTSNRNKYQLTDCMTPLWISMSVAFVMRVYRLNLSNYLNALLFLLLRGLQPLLIALQIDRHIHIKWSIVFIPAWIFLFSGIGIAIIIITCAPYVHRSSSTTIREISYVLLYIFALQILIASVCILLFLIYIVQELDFLYGFNDGKSIGVIKILWPLITMFLLLICLHPILMRAVDRYQMSFLVSMQLNATLSNILASASHNVAELEPITDLTWFLQINHNSYQVIDNISSFLNPIDLISFDGSIHPSNRMINNPITTINNDAVEESIDNTVDEAIRLLNVCRVAYNNRSSITNPIVHIPNLPNTDRNMFDIELGSLPSQNHTITRPIDNRNDQSYTRVRTESDSLLDNSTRSTSSEIDRPVDTIIQTQDSADLCVVCLTNPCDCILMPCGHFVLCYTCAQQLAKRIPSSCPICRQSNDRLYLKSIGPITIGSDEKVVIGSKEGFKIKTNRQTLLSNSIGNLFDGLSYRIVSVSASNINNNNIHGLTDGISLNENINNLNNS